MDRSVALRACVIFMIAMGIAAAVGVSAQADIAEALFVISGSLGVIMLFFALTAPTYTPLPLRSRRRD
ncbi:hypothetical protein AB4072_02310 [Microvirga sp. 2MCAF38]|uniref:hypothetical protein n=1 Tax=Microvirga sp. 2MCAF38 TaxID=3232989 RepID=UPI003F9D1DF0